MAIKKVKKCVEGHCPFYGWDSLRETCYAKSTAGRKIPSHEGVIPKMCPMRKQNVTVMLHPSVK